MEGFTWKYNSELAYLALVWQATSGGMVQGGFSTRHGGFSAAPYATLNLGLHVGDRDHHVLTNRERWARALNLPQSNWVTAQQVHGASVLVVDKSYAGLGIKDYPSALPRCDALVTATPGVALTLFFADCMPVWLWDPVHGVIAMVHAGWKGTIQGIAARALQTMTATFETYPGDCQAIIGPGIGACCYQIDEPVYQAFNGAYPQWCEQAMHALEPGRWRLDLAQANMLVLAGAGVKPEAIQLAGLCTCCAHDLFFSYRREKVTGRMAATIALAG